MPWAHHLYACDGSWWGQYLEKVLATFPGKKWTQDEKFKGHPAITHVESTDGWGLCPDKLVQGQNSGYQAINLAWAFLKADVVILLGYDMQGRGAHWFGLHPPTLSQNTNYEGLVGNFRKMHPERYGLKVVNCSRQTALDCFERMTLEEAIAKYCSKKI